MSADLAVFHEFAPPPTGGGHQFMRALCAELEGRGLQLEYNQLSRHTPVCLCNSYNFKLRKLSWQLRFRRKVRCVHRIDGPLQSYRGFDDGTDAIISDFNRRFADVSIVQSRFSLEQHQALGLSARNPQLIGNTPDPEIFFPGSATTRPPGEKLKLISVSWSDNPNKGLEVYQWMDEHLDPKRVDWCFVGRLQGTLKNFTQLDPLPSKDLAALLREQDAYLTASRHDPCSNSVMEALACGLPVLYLNSGGHPELVGEAGLPFEQANDIPQRLEQLRNGYSHFDPLSRVPGIQQIADSYLHWVQP